MSDWFHNLPVLWMALVVFAVTFSITAAVYGVANAGNPRAGPRV